MEIEHGQQSDSYDAFITAFKAVEDVNVARFSIMRPETIAAQDKRLKRQNTEWSALESKIHMLPLWPKYE